MSLFSFLRKNKQESASEDSTFYSRAEEDSKAMRNRSKRRNSAQGEGRGASQTDPVLPEKKRARRRLIGAMALVLAAVIGLPMILDSEPKPVADDIVIQIPSKDKPETASKPTQAAPAQVEAEAALDPQEEVIATAPEASGVKTVPKSVETSPSGATHAATSNGKTTEPAKSANQTAKVADKPQSVMPPPAAKPEAKSEIKTPPKSDEAARALALLEGRPDPRNAEKKSEKFVIQVAALATKEKVNELQSKLSSAGIRSYTQKVGTGAGERTRIRVGPFTSKEEAEKVRARIVKLGLNGSLVPV